MEHNRRIEKVGVGRGHARVREGWRRGQLRDHYGEAYDVRPGHTPAYPWTEIVEFSPTGDFQQTMDVVGKTMKSMG